MRIINFLVLLYLIYGKSGAGKSTLLNAILGDITYDGEINLDNQNSSLKDSVGVIYQKFNLIEYLTVSKNLSIGLEADIEEIDRVLRSFEIEHLKNVKVKFLSEGERQRVSIARAILRNPKILLCDEPTASLDKENEELVYELLHEIAKKRLVILVTHNVDNALKYADKVLEVKDRKLIEQAHEKESIETKYKIENVEYKSKKTNKLTFKENIALAFNMLKRKTLAIVLLMLILSVTLSFSMVACNICNISKVDTAYSTMDKNTLDKKFFIVSNIKDQETKNLILEKNFLNSDKAYLYSSMLEPTGYLKIDSFRDIKLVKGEYPTSKKEVVVTSSYDKKIGESVVYRNETYTVSAICSDIFQSVKKLIISTEIPIQTIEYNGPFPLSYQTYVDYKFDSLKDLNKGEIAVSNDLFDEYSLEKDKLYNTVNSDDMRAINPTNVFGNQIKVKDIIEQEKNTVYLSKEDYLNLEKYYNKYLAYDYIVLNSNFSKDFLESIMSESGFMIANVDINSSSINFDYLETVKPLFKNLSIIFIIISVGIIISIYRVVIIDIKKDFAVFKILHLKYFSALKNIFFAFFIVSLIVGAFNIVMINVYNSTFNSRLLGGNNINTSSGLSKVLTFDIKQYSIMIICFLILSLLCSVIKTGLLYHKKIKALLLSLD